MLKTHRNIEGILFDFDGTLTRPGAIDFQAIKRELGCPPDQPILEFLDTRPAQVREALMGVLDRREEEAAARSSPNAGAEACLAVLKREGFSLGILTRNSLKSVKKALEKFAFLGIADFAAVVTREVSLPKPHPDGVLKGAKVMGLSASELCVVGDFRFDIIAGHAAGAATVLLTNGSGNPLQPGDPPPDFVISHLEEILSILIHRP